ncbi:MAG TPA: 16S rRNA (adenine(1518)-N(6)/adenine(1519)-N(6))-dimethyltransferase RsmA [Chthoniobacterales bacterium]
MEESGEERAYNHFDGEEARVTLSEIMSTLEGLGAAPLKSLGQNFLHDQNVAAWIVQRLELSPGEHVVEIGPGLGALTKQLADAHVSATLLEKDAAYAAYLQAKFAGAGFEVVAGDALDYDPRRFFAQRPVKLVGMLPYYISSTLLLHFTREPCPFDRVVVTVQKELAERMAAPPGEKAYGSLSVALQRRWHVRKIKTLPASVFVPQPRVDSAVVLLTPKTGTELEPVDAEEFERLVRLGFSQRRKQLRKLLATRYGVEQLQETWNRIGLAADVRAEALSLPVWVRLSGLLGRKIINGNGTTESLQVVDEQDRPVRGLNRAMVHQERHLHRAVHVLLLNPAGELYLQRRSFAKDRYPGRWDSSAAGHVDCGETYADCATREVSEELGLTARLELVGKLAASEATGQEFVEVFCGQVSERPMPNPLEIDAFGAFSLEVVNAWLARCPQDFAPAFVSCYHLGRERLRHLAGSPAPGVSDSRRPA